VALTASTTNGTIYVPVSGTVTQSTNADFPTNTVPMAKYTTNVSAITAITDFRTFINTNITTSSSTGSYAFSYSTNTQNINNVNTFNNISFTQDIYLIGWTRSSTTFTCTNTGIYRVEYHAEATTTALVGGSTVSFIATKNAVEIAASQVAITFPAALAGVTPISTTFISNFSNGDLLVFRMASTSSSANSISSLGNGSTKPSFKVIINQLA
jgi:hypothetical protein